MADAEAEEPGSEAPRSPRPGLAGRVERRVVALLELAGGAALAVLTALTVSDALLRSFANRPILGANDMIQVLLVIVVAAAIPLCIHAGRAIAVEIITDRLPVGVRHLLSRLTNTLCAVALAVLSWRCVINAEEAALFGETTMLLQIPFGPFYWCLALSFALGAIIFGLYAIQSGRSQ